jgi:hypothetical protein
LEAYAPAARFQRLSGKARQCSSKHFRTGFVPPQWL